MSVFLAAIWCGLWWRLRGGALTALTGFDPGTLGMRAIAAIAIAAAFAFPHWRYGALMLAMWLAWDCAGWGAFQSMGASPIEMKNPVAAGLAFVGVRSRLWNDIAGMAIEGAFVMAFPAVVVALVNWDVSAFPMVSATGLAFSPLYLAAQKSPWLPNLGRFARGGSEWAEVLVGLWVGVVLDIVTR